MEKRNITLSLPTDLLKKAKAAAASKDKSLSRFLRESLEERLTDTAGYNKAMERQLKLMNQGLSVGIKDRITLTRDKIHERR